MTEPNQAGRTRGPDPDDAWPGGFAGWTGGPAGFAVPAEPPIEGYPAPGSAVGSTSAGYPGPGYPAAGYPASGYPAAGNQASGDPAAGSAAPGYAAPGYPASGYPGPGYPYGAYPPAGYPPAGWAAPPHTRPGPVTGAAVMAFVTAGFDIVGALATLGAATTRAFVGAGSGALVWITIVVSLVSAGLLIAGGVDVLRGRLVMLYIGAGGTIAVAIYWIVLTARALSGDRPIGGLPFYPLLYLAKAVVTVGLATSSRSRAWFSSRAAGGYRR